MVTLKTNVYRTHYFNNTVVLQGLRISIKVLLIWTLPFKSFRIRSLNQAKLKITI
jgi:hypothetical protein